MEITPPNARWADEPYPLLSSAKVNQEKGAHEANRVVREMIHAHNDMIRWLNSIVLQGPHVPAGDVPDFLLYVQAWLTTVEHHHRVEETVLFPGLAKLSDSARTLVTGPVEEHAAFHDGMENLQAYLTESSQHLDKYSWERMKSVIDSFAADLVDHFTTEPYLLLELEQLCESNEVKKVMDATEKAAVNDVSFHLLYNIFPGILGSADKTYEGGNVWPSLPPLMPFAMKWWFARRNRGAWRFCPCDIDGQPRPLEFLPQDPAI